MNKTCRKINEVPTGLLNAVNLREALNCGRKSAEEIAEAAKATVRVGRRKLYNWKKIQEYLDSISE